jgi:ATP-binding cassette subfamily B protein
VLGGIALCAQRLLPSIQQSFQAYSTIVATKQSLSDALNLLDQPIRSYISNINTLDIRSFKSIKLNYVSFQYGPTSPFVFQDACIEIKKGERIGIVGPTGSGKSTLLDIVMGLLRPTDGHLMLDEQTIDDDFVNAWQKNVAHVPQNIYLMDSSLAENIAFGIPKSKIDMNRVIRAAEQAQIADFIDGLPQKYQTFAGERGIRFSGGQKQRIGIARALYKQASILILDEATSSLDAVTEQSVMDAIDGLDNEFTVLIVAHRLSTLSSCDKIFKVELGKITMSTPRKEKPKLMDSN